MSPGFVKMPDELLSRSNLTPTAKIVAAVSADLQRRGKPASIRILQSLCALGKHAVIRARRELHGKGLGGGAECALPPSAESAPPKALASAESAPKVVPKAHPKTEQTEDRATAAAARWDAKAVRFIVPEDTLQRWRQTYKHLDVDAVLQHAAEWYAVDPKRQKKNHGRFLVNWLNRERPAQAGGNGSGQTPQQARRAAKLAGEFDGGAPLRVRHV